jgi:hypothetical protein
MLMEDRLYKALVIAVGILSAGPAVSGAATVRLIANMVQGATPNALIEGSPGLFYLLAGGPNAIISVSTHGTITTLASFPDPGYILESNPGSIAANGLLYSSVANSPTVGNFVFNVFSVGTSASSEQIYSTQNFVPFVTGNLPDTKLFGLVYDSLNNSYLGTTDLKGNVTTFYPFAPYNRPAGPIYGADGNYYGTSYPAVAGATTYFYQVTPSGAFTQVATLPFVTVNYQGGGLVLEGTDGNFYGVQSTGLGCPTTQHGGVYKLTPSGQYTLLHDFGTCAKAIVDSLIEASDGKLYGITEGPNIIFSLTKSGVYQNVAQLNGIDGFCGCGIIQGHDGIIYGAASGGGSTGSGTVFAVDLGLPKPKPRAQRFHPATGPAGTQVLIWGYNLFEASVQFNGVPATVVRNSGSNYVWAAVPAGATSGPLTVTTPGGTTTTHASFTLQ